MRRRRITYLICSITFGYFVVPLIFEWLFGSFGGVVMAVFPGSHQTFRPLFGRVVSDGRYSLPSRNIVWKFNCPDLLRGGNSSETPVKLAADEEFGDTLSADKLRIATRDCSEYKRNRGYILHHLTEEERTFPIAYSISMYKDPGQVERLLRAIYRPQNIHCIHVDKESPELVQKTVKALSQCFENVFLSTRQIDVRWDTGGSILEAQLGCLRDLYHRDVSWKYYINLAGQEFPLKTNLEIVRALKALNETNDIQRSFQTNPERYAKAGIAPYDIKPLKGSHYVAITREFANFTLHDVKAKEFLKWLNGTTFPDESFFSSLHYNPHLNAPGHYKGNATGKIPFNVKAVNWGNNQWKCHGRFVRSVCIAGTGDLPIVVARSEMFLNKVYWDYHPLVLECLDEWLYNKTKIF